MNDADVHNHINDTIPIGSPVFLTLSDGENITSKTDRNTGFILHYLWRYNGGTVGTRGYDGVVDFNKCAWHDDKDIPGPTYGAFHYYYDVYGTTWQVKFEFTPSDMLALSKNRIIDAHAGKGSQIILIPIKKRQSKIIKEAIAVLLRN